MEDINNLIEQYYELSNYGSAEKIHKLLKLDDITIKLKTIKEFLNKKEEVQLMHEDKQTKNKYFSTEQLMRNYYVYNFKSILFNTNKKNQHTICTACHQL